ncbi:hypothetical protein GCM10009119_37890 [Algoriphagus jejuensis]|uniref:Uncharacterized protein n=1 Tax=Algoriphagus jejuensis TaxID=419934 RepID=A0ABP3YH77_9BACT
MRIKTFKTKPNLKAGFVLEEIVAAASGQDAKALNFEKRTIPIGYHDEERI